MEATVQLWKWICMYVVITRSLSKAAGDDRLTGGAGEGRGGPGGAGAKMGTANIELWQGDICYDLFMSPTNSELLVGESPQTSGKSAG